MHREIEPPTPRKHGPFRTDVLRSSALQPNGWLRELALDCLALLWPTACVGCELPDRDLCVRCARELGEASSETFDLGGISVPCFAAGPYSGTARAALIAYKHQGAFGLVRPLGRRLALPLRLACGEASRDPPAIITIPSRARRVRERGYRHVDELVRVALRGGGVVDGRSLIWTVQGMPVSMPVLMPVLMPALMPVLMPALRPLRGRTGQVGLDVQSREENAGRIAVRRLWVPDLRGREVILVDDIVTTGATLRAAQKVLEAAGARVIAVVALCVAARRDTPETHTGNRT